MGEIKRRRKKPKEDTVGNMSVLLTVYVLLSSLAEHIFLVFSYKMFANIVGQDNFGPVKSFRGKRKK